LLKTKSEINRKIANTKGVVNFATVSYLEASVITVDFGLVIKADHEKLHAIASKNQERLDDPFFNWISTMPFFCL
jgi:hypothetical protein